MTKLCLRHVNDYVLVDKDGVEQPNDIHVREVYAGDRYLWYILKDEVFKDDRPYWAFALVNEQHKFIWLFTEKAAAALSISSYIRNAHAIC